MVIKAEKNNGNEQSGLDSYWTTVEGGIDSRAHFRKLYILKMSLLKTLPVFVSLKWPHTLCFNFCHLPSFRIVIVEVNRLVTEINQTKCKKDGRLVLKETLDPYPNKCNNDKQNI